MKNKNTQHEFVNLENLSWVAGVPKNRRNPEKSILKSVEADVKMLGGETKQTDQRK